MIKEKIFMMSFSKIYDMYVQKVTSKGRKISELNEIVFWLTGYNEESLKVVLDNGVTLEDFFKDAPKINKNASLIKGVICGYRVEEIEDKQMQKVRYLDKLVDELAKGKSLDKILRK